MKNKKGAFTLVELLVVIIILSILSTVSFISLQGYSKSARNSVRMSHIDDLKSTFETFLIETGKYPEPDNKKIASYNGDSVWYQGTIGDMVTTRLSKTLKKKPLDPLSNSEYIYSTTVNGNGYEILALYEGGDSNINTNYLLNQTLTYDSFSIKIDGNYNHLFVETTNYIIPLPSIINSELITNELILNDENIKSQVINGGDNIPSFGEIITQTGKLDFNLKVFTGSIKNNSTNIEKENLGLILQSAYSGTILANKGIYKTLLEKSTPTEIIEIINLLVLNNNEQVILTFPSGTVIAMPECPDNWTETGNVYFPSGFLTTNVLCNGIECKTCESNGESIKSGTVIAMQKCPNNWTETGDVYFPSGISTTNVLCNGINCKTCESNGYDIPSGTKVIMNSCPIGWKDIGGVYFPSGISTTNVLCNGAQCRTCEKK